MYELLAVTSTAALLAVIGPDHEGTHDWTGVYAGAQIATPVHGRNRWYDPEGNVVNLRQSFSGVHGGVHLGYNHQWNRLVLGAEAEIGHGRFRANARTDRAPNCVEGCNTEFSTIGAVRARAGYAYGNSLVYAHAGWAVARSRSEQIGGDAESPPFEVSGTAHGHTWGYGVEHAMNDRVSLRLQYSHMVYNPVSDDNGIERVRSRFGTMSVAVNYRF